MSKYMEISLGELVTIKGGKRLPKGKALQVEKSDHPYIRVRDMGSRFIDKNTLEYVPNETFEKISLYIVNEGDLIISIVGTIGLVSLIGKELDKASQTENCAKLVGLNKTDASYLYYFLTSRIGQQRIYQGTVGAVQAKLPLYSIDALNVIWPEEENRKAIAHILGKLDDKIELNRQMNQTLEEMAQALFKSWFVDFDPVFDNALAAGNKIPEALKAKAERRTLVPDEKKLLHKNSELAEGFPSSFVFNETLDKWIPEGWGLEKLGKKVEIKRGGSPRPIKDFIVESGYPWLKIADATAEKSPFIFKTREFIKEEGLRKTVYLDKGELILSNSATPGLPKFLDIKACIHDGWLYFPKKDFFSDEYLYFLFLELRATFISKGNGSVFTNLKTDILKNQDVVIPNVEIMTRFTMFSKTYLQRLKKNRIQTETLTNLRDTLLPQLISGKVRVPEGFVEKFGENNRS